MIRLIVLNPVEKLNMSDRCVSSLNTWTHDAAGRWLNRVVRGYFNYHAVPGNLTRLEGFRAEVTRAWRQALLRRSQKRRLP